MIQVIDELGTLNRASKADLEATPVAFDAKVFYTSAKKDVLEVKTKGCVTSPSTLCISVNPIDKVASVAFGSDVAPLDMSSAIRKAGNPSFRQGNWEQGMKDIILRAQSLSAQARTSSKTTPVIIQQPVQTVEHPVSAWPFIIGFGAIGALVLFVAIVVRRQNKKVQKALEDSQREAAEMASNNIKAAEDHEMTEKLLKEQPPRGRAMVEGFNKMYGKSPEPLKRGRTWSAPHPTSGSYRTPPRHNIPIITPIIPTPVIPQQPIIQPVLVRDSSNDFLNGVLIGESMRRDPVIIVDRPDPPRHEHHHRVVKEDTPEPTMSSSTGSIFDSDSRSDGGSAISDSSGSFSDDVGGSTGGFDD